MGPENSKEKEQPQQQKQQQSPRRQQIPEPVQQEEYEGIPIIPPLVLSNNQYPPDLIITPDRLPEAHQLSKTYFYNISSRINKNEQVISTCVRKQLEEYVTLPKKLEGKQNELNNRLGKILTMFKQLDDEVKLTTESLSSAITKANKIAQLIDPQLPAFQ